MATRLQPPSSGKTTAILDASTAYDAVGDSYRDYADGSLRHLFDFSSQYSFADREIWDRIDAVLKDMRAAGRRDLHVLDAGCGPGTWLLRIVARAQALGFNRIEARGFDVSPEMVRLANAQPAHGLEDIDLRFEVGDLTQAMPETSSTVDLTLCLYGVLNHLDRKDLDHVAAELTRVTRGQLFVTVRTVGSLPTIYVDSIEKARSFAQDHGTDRMEIDLVDGRHIGFTSHLFCAAELRALFRAHAAIAGLAGLDLFHSRFAANPRWNPAELPYEDVFERELCQLEKRCACDPAFMDRAAHILLHADCSR